MLCSGEEVCTKIISGAAFLVSILGTCSSTGDVSISCWPFKNNMYDDPCTPSMVGLRVVQFFRDSRLVRSIQYVVGSFLSVGHCCVREKRFGKKKHFWRSAWFQYWARTLLRVELDMP